MIHYCPTLQLYNIGCNRELSKYFFSVMVVDIWKYLTALLHKIRVTLQKVVWIYGIIIKVARLQELFWLRMTTFCIVQALVYLVSCFIGDKDTTSIYTFCLFWWQNGPVLDLWSFFAARPCLCNNLPTNVSRMILGAYERLLKWRPVSNCSTGRNTPGVKGASYSLILL